MSSTSPVGIPALPLFARLTSRWCLLILLCAVRQVLNLTEQPSSSVMQYFPYFKFVVRALKTYGMEWFETSLRLACVQTTILSNFI